MNTTGSVHGLWESSVYVVLLQPIKHDDKLSIITNDLTELQKALKGCWCTHISNSYTT